MNQSHYDVFHTANKGALVHMLMRALDEISDLNQENDDLNQTVCSHIETGVKLREELSQAEAATEYYQSHAKSLQAVNEQDRADLNGQYTQQTTNIAAFVTKRPKPHIFRELFGDDAWFFIERAVAADKKIVAIKILRQYSNLGLKDAKDCIDALIESRAPKGD